MNAEKLAKLQASVRIGGKGTPRRKHKATAKVVVGDDKKVSAALKKLGTQAVTGIDEVNFFHKNSKVTHITKPKVQAAIGSNTFAITGHVEIKDLESLMPGIIGQLGRDYLQQIAGAFGNPDLLAQAAGAEEDDSDIPDLVDTNFEEASKAEEETETKPAEEATASA